MPRIDVLVSVADVAAACRFYELAGLTREAASEEFATMKAGDANLWLHRHDDGEPAGGGGVEVWIGVDDVDEVHRRLAAAGIGDLRPPLDVQQWGLRVTSAPDPDGRRVYFTTELETA
ncbi:MAG: VOC family protein [Acidimicrobiales bacterium]